MFKQTAVLAVTGVGLLVGCGGMDPRMENEEIISNLIEAGYPANDIRVIDEAVFVSGDAHVTLQASREMIQTPPGSAEHYRSTNLVGAQVTKICINPSAAFSSSPNLSQGLDLAIGNYNALGLRFTFARGPTTGCSATIAAEISTIRPENWAGFPSDGLPYGSINMIPAMNDQPLDINEHIITHELGHTLGLRHTDYYDRSISCVPPYTGVEGDEDVGIIHIPGTPTTAVWDGSVMNACPHIGSTGEFTSADITALNILYGQSATQSCSNVNVAAYRGQTGAQIRCTCSSGGGGSVWGTNLYTDDSNICTAAVHAGVMTTSGGAVVLEVQPAQSTFIGTNRNGVTTSSYGAWGGSFRFIGAQVPQPPPLCSSFNIMSYRGQNGSSIRCNCPTVSLGASVWGTDLYTDDSDVCAAAVHAGAIPSTGGQVSVTIQPAQGSYASTTRNGVTTYSYGYWSGSISLSP
ncbi:M57 family metalloprotease [Myxococcus xanthus]|uniref:M57 family metalloprotease n=1 Tax=Myxococcus xanthus TaxID=34 RepID=UPI0011263BDF|nr:M57 family metalloprotease [Myxococcus xanthus]QDE99010.1 protease B [Myxococcus xanthus]